ncbi:unnamed protein product [Lactuca virosa]|uniref:Uncharacterized protein n=1 Tax=Lactuca virosa TaxID=75947 RepID=A0AAU9LFG2_9ASTR|nr:unnamed protein product [Lactuca virosa]
MANLDPIFLKVRLHYNSVFTRHPHRYTGGETFMFTDHDFSGMDLHGCCEFLDRFVGEPFEKLYYLARDLTMANGLRVITNEMDYQVFIDVAYQSPERPIDLYLDHIGEGFEDWFDEESDESGSVIKGDDKETAQGIPDREPAYMFDAGLDDEINGKYCTPLNKTKDDEFLNKLCPEGREEKKIEEIDNSEELDNDVLEEHPIFNPHGENVKKRTAEVASGSRTGMDGGDTHGSRVKRTKTTKGENVKKRTAEEASGSRTRMECGDTQGTRESGTTQVTRVRGNVVIPQLKRRKKE